MSLSICTICEICGSQNCYGPEGTWTGGGEKAPAAICRKVAEAKDGGTIEVWGDGTAIRAYTYVSDLVEGIYVLMHSDPSAGSGHRLEGPTNIGSSQYVTVDELAETVIEVAGKEIRKKYVKGPVGVQARNPSLRQPFDRAQDKAQYKRQAQGTASARRLFTRWAGRPRFPSRRGSLARIRGSRHR